MSQIVVRVRMRSAAPRPGRVKPWLALPAAILTTATCIPSYLVLTHLTPSSGMTDAPGLLKNGPPNTQPSVWQDTYRINAFKEPVSQVMLI